jgi:putative ABC transport system permease protein
VIIGLGIGLAATFAVGRLLQTQLYEVKSTDPFLLSATAVTLTVVAVLACLIPARRATLVNPIQALRNE